VKNEKRKKGREREREREREKLPVAPRYVVKRSHVSL